VTLGVEKRYLKGSGGLRLAATVGGDPKGEPVLFLHGGGQTRSSWGHGAKKLAERGYHVMALDARGHGDSGWGGSEDSYALDFLIADLKAVIATLDRPPTLVGASMGGITSLVAIGESETPIASALVMVDVTPRLSPAGTQAIFGFMNANPNGFATLDEVVESVAAYLPHRPRPADGGKGLMRNLRHGKDGRLYWHWDPAFTASLGRFQEETQARMLAAAMKVTVPTMLIRGGNSEIVSTEAVEEFHALLPGAEIVEISGAHHMVAGDRNDAFNKAVIGFLDRHVPPGG
jgi:non-heme chloroperoxidase